jgi:hypothetical protein
MQACKLFLCESCDLTFETGDLRIKHKYEDHSEIGSIAVDGINGIELPCLRTSEGLLKCPSSDCPNYQRLHRSTFVKHLLKHKMRPVATKRAATGNPDSSRLHKIPKVMGNYTDGERHLSLPVAPHIISYTHTSLQDHSAEPVQHSSRAAPSKSSSNPPFHPFLIRKNQGADPGMALLSDSAYASLEAFILTASSKSSSKDLHCRHPSLIHNPGADEAQMDLGSPLQFHNSLDRTSYLLTSGFAPHSDLPCSQDPSRWQSPLPHHL